mgnify:FL=1
MYPYFNHIKQRIFNNELLSDGFVEKDKEISPCLLLHFDTDHKVRATREHRFREYDDLFLNFSKR